jgi:hypothetical protein
MYAIRSGSIANRVYFDGAPGLTGFTVVRSRNGAAGVSMTTPTIAEVANMAGTYGLLVDEDTTIEAGFGSQPMRLRVAHPDLPQGRVLIDILLYVNDLTHLLGNALGEGGDAPASPIGYA